MDQSSRSSGETQNGSENVLEASEGSPKRPKEVRVLSDVERAWLAGVIDGEGSIIVSKVAPSKGYYRRGFYYKAALEVANSNEEFLRRTREVIGKGWVNLNKEKNPQWRDKWQYSGSSLVLKRILPQVMPYLVAKRAVARKMQEYLAFVDANPIDGRMEVPAGFDEKRDALYWEIKRLNERGAKVEEDASRHLRKTVEGDSQPTGRKRGRPYSHRVSARVLGETERAWLAGVIDGEGSIFLSKVSGTVHRRGFFYRPQLAVSNTNLTFLMKVKNAVGEGTVQLSKKGKGGWKTRWEYCAVAGVVRYLLPQILPHLVVKRAVAEKMMEYLQFIDSNPIFGPSKVPVGYYEKLDGIYWAIKNLNRKGRISTSTV